MITASSRWTCVYVFVLNTIKTSYTRSSFVSSSLGLRVLKCIHIALAVSHSFSVWSSVPEHNIHLSVPTQFSECYLGKQRSNEQPRIVPQMDTPLLGVIRQWVTGPLQMCTFLAVSLPRSALKYWSINFKQSLLNKRWGHISNWYKWIQPYNSVTWGTPCLSSLCCLPCTPFHRTVANILRFRQAPTTPI